ncbi:MAG: 3-hydroxyacyl-CoA dehydrogenase NAD-binding domain-containing protein [Candidatus Bathyarchaeia archaeon]
MLKGTAIGVGLMGHGVAQISAQVAKFEVSFVDGKQEFLDKGMAMINDSLQRFLKKGVITEDKVKETLERIYPTMSIVKADGDWSLRQES